MFQKQSRLQAAAHQNMTHSDDEFGEGESEDTRPVNMANIEDVEEQKLHTPLHYKSNNNCLKRSR